jgi:hypothetical protein
MLLRKKIKLLFLFFLIENKMGNIITSVNDAATLKATYDTDKAARDTASTLSPNGDTTINKALTVTGKSTFNDDITLATGKKLNGIDVAGLSTNLSTLEKSVSGMNSAVSGDFAGKAITGATNVTASGAGTFGSVTSTGLGTYGSLKTSDIDINGNITSSTGKSFITTADATGIRFSNGLPVTDAKYAYQTIDTATGEINIMPGAGKKVTIGTGGSGKRVTITDGNMTANQLYVDTGLKDYFGTTYLTASELKFGNTMTLTKNLLTVPAVTTTGAVTSGSHVNNGALTNTGALKLGTNKWLINEVVSTDATKGTRLCFGSEDSTGKATYWTCMNKDGNLEKF